METGLPSMEESVNLYKMRIEGIWLKDYECNRVQTTFDVQQSPADVSPLYMELYEISEPRIQGYMPSKIMYDARREDLACTFYCNDTLPDRVRPFGTDPMYVGVYYPDDVRDTVLYDIECRLFVDQVVTGSGIAYVFVFGQETYEKIVIQNETTN